ncbi:MAG: hypothetical protein EOO01_26205 [Chitinophagaceae bacterium]|nr:MAG: hypothetical protein EOO01_26205 [Chitinophagaceae bacterium]
MDTPHDHKFDGKEDRNFHQKPFDDVTDELPQIDKASADLQIAKKSEQYGDTDAAGKGPVLPSDSIADGASAAFAPDDETLSDSQRVAQFKPGKE